MPNTEAQLAAARQCIAEGMTVALGLWFVPIPVAGSVACNEAEKIMIKGICRELGRPQRVDDYYWFFRKKYFLVNIVTFIPYVGATVQLLEVYALGQFVLTCCDEDIDVSNQGAMDQAWSGIEPKLWKASDVISFYETVSGKPFPQAIKGPFREAVKQIGGVVQGMNKIPGLQKAQEVASEGMRKGLSLASDVAKGTWKEAKRDFKKLFG